jgi:aspartyl-tRNA(Asn)/glutamyl-tRNA(Gln) amidotransferase subunit C
MITKDDVIKVADISKLKFTEEELLNFTKKFDEVIGFVEKIKEVDTSGVEPTYTVNDDDGIMKDNGESQTLTKGEVLQNAHDTQYGYFKILKVVE